MTVSVDGPATNATAKKVEEGTLAAIRENIREGTERPECPACHQKSLSTTGTRWRRKLQS